MMNARLLLTSIAVLIGLVGLTGCQSTKKAKSANSLELRIFHAGSLSVPIKEISQAFMAENPGVKILTEAAGSVQCIRKITDLGQVCDVLAVADYSLIDELLFPEHADWNVLFASNEMVLAWLGEAGFAGPDSLHWYRTLTDPKIRYGRSNPDADPCGYRTILSLKLADKYYADGVPWEEILAKDQQYIRSKETDLNALLESGSVDYIFTYRSVAVQHGFRYLRLPDSVNLSNPHLEDWYSEVSVDIPGSKPGERLVKKGAAMYYGITIPHKAPKEKLAGEYIRFLLDPAKGGRIIEQCGQTVIPPAFTPSSRKVSGLF